MDSLQGHFFVASPHLPDSNFYRTVVLMVQHDEQGALGLVLNRPTDTTVAQLWETVVQGAVLVSASRQPWRPGPRATDGLAHGGGLCG